MNTLENDNRSRSPHGNSQYGGNTRPWCCGIALAWVLAPLAILAYPPTDDPVLERMRPLATNVVTYAAGQDLIRPPDVPIVPIDSPQPTSPPSILPDDRVGVLVPKGVYHVSFTQARDVNLFGETGNPADVELWSDEKGSGGAMHALGPLYVEGVTLRTEPSPGGSGPKYPLHLTFVHRFFRRAKSTIFANCRFVANSSWAGTPGNAMGMDGGGNTYTLFYQCEIKGVGTNMHGGYKEPLTLLYVKCKGTDIVYTDCGTGAADKVYVIDCEFPSVKVHGRNATLYISEGSKIGSIIADNVVTNSAWPMPTRGLGPDDPALAKP